MKHKEALWNRADLIQKKTEPIQPFSVVNQFSQEREACVMGEGGGGGGSLILWMPTSELFGGFVWRFEGLDWL